MTTGAWIIVALIAGMLLSVWALAVVLSWAARGGLFLCGQFQIRGITTGHRM